jgi:CO/xanthine dehydrogenase FAD-binding subunit
MRGLMDVHMPGSLGELWAALEAEPEAVPMAGGTDLLVNARAGHVVPGSVICLERIAELKGVRDQGLGLWIGAGETHAALLRHPLVREHIPLLTEALSVLGSPLIRNVGTVGGNICTASPAGDSLPSLYVLGADLELISRSGTRLAPISDFILGPGKTALRKGEILKGIRVKKAAQVMFSFEKVGCRQAMSIAVVSLAALFRFTADGLVSEARLAWGSVGPTVITSVEAEKALMGRPLTRASLEEAAERARQAVRPIDDIMASAAYRRAVAGNLLLRLGTRRACETTQHGVRAAGTEPDVPAR